MDNTLNILYATMWGNAEMVAKKLNHIAEEKGFTTKVAEMNDISMEELCEMKKVAIVTSTTGHGDLPTNGEEFYDALKVADLNLREMKYGVLALGDSSHKHFCGAGKKVDERFEQRGANKIIERLECDGGTEGSIEWSNKFLETIQKND